MEPTDIAPDDIDTDNTGLRNEANAVIAEDPASEIAARLVRTFTQWETARETKKKENKRCNEQLAGKISLFSEAMNVGHSNSNDQILKLSIVETRWQDLEDAREEKKQVNGACRDAIKALETKIKDLMAEAKSGQLSLFNPSAEAADGGGNDDVAA